MTEVLQSISITITPTPEVVVIAGQACRVWNGVTTDGAKCLVCVALVAFPEHERSNLEQQLIAIRPQLFDESGLRRAQDSATVPDNRCADTEGRTDRER